MVNIKNFRNYIPWPLTNLILSDTIYLATYEALPDTSNLVLKRFALKIVEVYDRLRSHIKYHSVLVPILNGLHKTSVALTVDYYWYDSNITVEQTAFRRK